MSFWSVACQKLAWSLSLQETGLPALPGSWAVTVTGVPWSSRRGCTAGTQAVRGLRSRGMTVLKTVSVSPLALADIQWGRAGWTRPESERFRERHLKMHALEEEFRGAGGNTLDGQDDAHKVSSTQEVNLQGGEPLELRARISRGLWLSAWNLKFTPDAVFFPILIELDFI